MPTRFNTDYGANFASMDGVNAIGNQNALSDTEPEAGCAYFVSHVIFVAMI